MWATVVTMPLSAPPRLDGGGIHFWSPFQPLSTTSKGENARTRRYYCYCHPHPADLCLKIKLECDITFAPAQDVGCANKSSQVKARVGDDGEPRAANNGRGPGRLDRAHTTATTVTSAASASLVAAGSSAVPPRRAVEPLAGRPLLPHS